jgi:hypothetical protein
MFVHVPIALGVQLVCWWIGHALGAPTRAAVWMGWFAGSSVCVMREITQREYQWIEALGQGRRRNMPWYEGLKFWEWNHHSVEETVVAIAVATVLAVIVSLLCARQRS